MTDRLSGKRLQVVAQWMKGRLSERSTVVWASKALQRVDRTVSQDTTALLDYLDGQAAREPNLHPEIKEIWHRLHVAARDRSTALFWPDAEGFKQAIRNDEFSNDDVGRLVDFVRPRLKAVGPSSFSPDADEHNDAPRQWLIWDLEAACGAVDRGVVRVLPELPRLSVGILSRLIRRGTDALEEALVLARQLGWMDEGRDLANSSVSRVAYTPPPDAGPRDKRDPDAYADSFAPLVRLLTAAFDALAESDPRTANTIAALWHGNEAALFLRIRAYAGWKGGVWDGYDVARFLESLSPPPFWQWSRFPEIASLRALRWRDIPQPERAPLAERLLAGPDADIFASEGDMFEKVALYWRDHELARVADNNEEVPEAIRRIVADRRRHDPEFPLHVPVVDPGRPNFRVTAMPEGDPAAFAGVAEDDLIKELANSVRSRRAGDPDDAKAYARRNQPTLVGALERHSETAENVEAVWRLLLAHPEDKADDPESARLVAERIATLALRISPELLDRLADRFSYWLDVTDENLGDFGGAVPLWQRLVPLASKSADVAASGNDVDLTTTALNAPLGHLISFFLRRCPSMPAAAEERSPLPEPFATTLESLEGHGRILMANRMVVALNYFWRADKAWVESLVLEAMLSAQPNGAVPLWEAFANYTEQLPDPDLWARLEHSLFLRIAKGRLSKEALGGLSRMAVVAWARSKQPGRRDSVSAPSFRSALSVAVDDARTAAAWQFSLLFDRDQAGSQSASSSDELWIRLGKAFFAEVWPMAPAAQSPDSAKVFARLPVRVGPPHFPDVVRTVLPYLRPFEIWAVDLEFGLDDDTVDLVRGYPVETLALVSACVNEDQRHPIYHLGSMLSAISSSRPDLEQDPMMRRLRRLIANDNR